MSTRYDAVVVGSGPNGLAAAITLARAGLHVLVLEAAAEPGGGARSGALTLPGFTHDLCSAVHPLAAASPFFRGLPLREHGLEWIEPPAGAAHPLDDGTCALLLPGVDETAGGLGPDSARYRSLLAPLAARWKNVLDETLRPALHVPRHPLLLARFGALSLLPATDYARLFFTTGRARALFAGIAAHANAPLEQPGTSGIGLMLNLAGHARGWPIPRGGAGAITAALISYFKTLGGEVRTGEPVRDARELPPSALTFWDLTPRQVAAALGNRLPSSERRAFEGYRYGPGVFKIDWALSGPIPWRAAGVARSATVHLGGTLEEIAASEAAPARGDHAERPYVLLSQPTLFDASRAPFGKHIAWAYCHVPHGSTRDMTAPIEAQIERFAPGFRDLILYRTTFDTRAMEARNANYIGGDINGGALSLGQLFFRPRLQLDPYRLPLRGHFLCSSSTPPGPGVHGMCGFHAAESALRRRGKNS